LGFGLGLSAASFVPHEAQNFAVGVTAFLHFGQAGPCLVPQFAQNFAPAATGFLHLVQSAPMHADANHTTTATTANRLI